LGEAPAAKVNGALPFVASGVIVSGGPSAEGALLHNNRRKAMTVVMGPGCSEANNVVLCTGRIAPAVRYALEDLSLSTAAVVGMMGLSVNLPPSHEG